jgi:hypothetical protein
MPFKSDLALELSEKGIDRTIIAVRLDCSLYSVASLIRYGRVRRSKAEMERLRRLADIMGANV